MICTEGSFALRRVASDGRGYSAPAGAGHFWPQPARGGFALRRDPPLFIASGGTRAVPRLRARGASFSCLRRPQFFQQPYRRCCALRRDPLLPSSAKVGKNAVQTCGLKIRSRPAHGILLFCIPRAVTLMQTSLNVELLLRLSPLPLRMQNVGVCSSIFQSKSGSAQRKKSMQHFGIVTAAPTTREKRSAKAIFAGAQEVLKPAVSSSPFGHFWGCGQK